MTIAGLRNLCTPSYVYLVISMILLIVMYIQNLNNVNVFCLGAYECDVTSVTAIFIINIVLFAPSSLEFDSSYSNQP